MTTTKIFVGAEKSVNGTALYSVIVPGMVEDLVKDTIIINGQNPDSRTNSFKHHTALPQEMTITSTTTLTTILYPFIIHPLSKPLAKSQTQNTSVSLDQTPF